MFILTTKCKEHESSVISPFYGWSDWAFIQTQKMAYCNSPASLLGIQVF